MFKVITDGDADVVNAKQNKILMPYQGNGWDTELGVSL